MADKMHFGELRPHQFDARIDRRPVRWNGVGSRAHRSMERHESDAHPR